MANEAIYIDGTELILETAAAATAITNGSFRVCDSDDRQPADNAGYPTGRFEFDTAAGGFTVAPTAGAIINIYEQTINSDGTSSPDPDANNTAGYIGSISIDPADTLQNWVTRPLTLNMTGGKYWIEWVDGGAGTAGIDLGWELRLIPVTIGPAA